jgi:serine/threonine protein kinase
MSWNQGHLLKSGQYAVVRLLGSGGFGMTYLANDLNLARQVVIKRPNLSFEADRDYDKFLRRFKREGQVLAQVQIPNIVRVIEFTEIDGMPCLVMDFVAGETLNDCIRRRGYIPEDEAVKIFQKLASAVEALHQQGIIHCDIHPGNIIVQPNGEPMLIDFGSTKLLHPTTWTVTTTVNKDFGPYDQMAESAENALGSQPAWDIYSLAANMFFAVTGEKPMSAISRKLYGDGLKAPKELKPGLTDRLNRMILQGMALEAKDRSSSVAIWINLLDVSPQTLPLEKISPVATEPISKNPESRSFTSAPPKQKTVSISSPPSKKKSKEKFPWTAILFLVLGYFLQGIALGNYSGAGDWALALALALAWAGALAWIGALAGDWAGALAGAVVGAWALAGALAWAGALAGTWAWAWSGAWAWAGAWLENNNWIDARQNRWFLMTILCGALLGGGFSGYLTRSGIIWGLCYGLFAWAIILAILCGYAGSDDDLNKNYGGFQVFLIYGIFSSIGLISGGMLGSWLKVAGIIKLP